MWYMYDMHHLYHIRTHVNVHAYRHWHVHTQKNMHIRMYTWILIHTIIYNTCRVYIHVCLWIHQHTYTATNIPTQPVSDSVRMSGHTQTHTHTQTHRYTHTNKHLLEWANIAPSCSCKILNCCNSTRNIRNCCKKSSVPYSARRRCVDCNLKSQYATNRQNLLPAPKTRRTTHGSAQKWRNHTLAGLPRTRGIQIFGYLVVKFPNSRFCWHTYDTLPITWILELWCVSWKYQTVHTELNFPHKLTNLNTPLWHRCVCHGHLEFDVWHGNIYAHMQTYFHIRTCTHRTRCICGALKFLNFGIAMCDAQGIVMCDTGTYTHTCWHAYMHTWNSVHIYVEL